jgi:hypothetical protein
MATLRVNTSPIIDRKAPYPPTGGNAPDTIRSAKRGAPAPLQSALEATATAIQMIGSSLTSLHAAARQNNPKVHEILVTDRAGKVVAAIGPFEYKGKITPNYFSEIHVGDPLKTGDPSLSLFNATPDGHVTIGQNGIITVLDPFGKDSAWLGTLADSLAVTGAADNGGGLIRLTVTAHTLLTGDSTTVLDVGGVPNAHGIWVVTKIDANHIDLQNSVWDGAFTGGGTVNRVLHILGTANNGSGKTRVNVVAHGFETGDQVNIVGANADGQWVVTKVDADHFDLLPLTFTSSGTGTVLRYFAGGLFQTVAVGPSFVDYRLRAFADGSLKIRNATFTLSLNGITTSITNATVGTVGVVGLEVQDDVSHDAAVVSATFISLFTTDPSNLHPAISVARNGTAGILSIFDGLGSLAANRKITADGSNGNISNTGRIDTTGDINTLGVYEVGGVLGRTVTRNLGTSLSVNTGSAVTGTPGAGQGTGTFVTSVTLTTTSHAFVGGILT